jgi:hypothetical protein
MKRSDAFPSQFLKAADLGGKAAVLKIEDARMETLKGPSGEQKKLVLAFARTPKRLVMNITNFESVAEITGEEDSDRWPGHRIEIYPTKVEMQGKRVDCIRVRRPPQPELVAVKSTEPSPPPPRGSDDDGMDDEIPF